MPERGWAGWRAWNPVRAITGRARGKGLRAQLVRGGAGSIVLKGCNALLQLIATAILARSLTVNGFGVYAYVLATTSLLAIPAHAGVPTLIVRLTATYQARGQWSLLLGLWQRTQQFVMVVSFVIVLLTIAFFLFADEGLTAGNHVLQLTLAAALLIVPIKSIAESRAAALRGLGRVVIGQMPDQLIRPLVHAVLILIFVMLPWIALSPPIAMGLHAVAAFAAMLFAVAVLAGTRPAACREVEPEYRTREWIKSVMPLSMLAGAQVILQQTGSVMLGVMSGVESVGLYRIAVQAAAVVGFGLLTATTVLSPHLARMHATGDYERAQGVITASARIVCAAAFSLTLLFILFGRPFIEIFFGAQYAAAYLPLVILCVGLLIKAAAGPAAAVLTMTGHERDAFLGVATATVANVAFNLMLIPAYGIDGAAMASTLAFGVWSIQLTRLAYKRTGFDSTILGIWRRGAGRAGKAPEDP